MNREDMLARRRELRKNPTYAERSLWSQLRRSQHGVKFRRQQGIGNFIVDFYSTDLKLIIEVDGSSHDLPEVQEYDAWRQAILESEGRIFPRFKDEEVLHDANRTLEKIDAKVAELKMLVGVADKKARV